MTPKLATIPTFLVLLLLTAGAFAEQSCRETVATTSPAAEFTPQGDGTVLQKGTGLVWMRCSLGQKWDGKTCSGKAGAFSWAEALNAAVQLDFAGKSDWRLPNINELESVVNERCVSPAIHAETFPATPGEFFWSSSPYAGQASAAWSVDFGFGTVTASDKGGQIRVRLVRDRE